ncbi:KilA-N domain-containing protein [Vibrio nigripulchritudo]|uniref:KilA-N domain-containing protein n=1 Tax=Vibrio nigripulchritudo TaxID=28173 RepID=UPI0024922777|nr:KilA-N domain-containing protein [Vibrio nigripulchritudo]BDU38743.1 hypothetical protein TUMSATVNIG2_32120 [Vibrio nigripulchritudo]BDU44463.1 hypothetical protein TUMSATVNIG3_32610 [Vibrio nigripulchritudo]
MPNLTILSKKIRIRDGLYSLNDLHKVSGGKSKHAPFRFMRNELTNELVKEIERSPDLVIASKVIKGGVTQGTWVCKELVYAYAMWISAKFHLQVIRAFDLMVTSQQLAPAYPHSHVLIANAITAAEKAYKLEIERQKELIALNEMVAQLERDARLARHRLEIAMHSHSKQRDNLAHIDTMLYLQ